MTPNEVFFGLITAAIIALVIALIWLCLRVGQAIESLKGFLETSEQSIQESLGEVSQNLKSLRTLTDNVNTAADNVLTFTGSFREIGNGVKQIAANIRQIGDIVQSLGTETFASVNGVRAGLRTGFEVFLKNLFRTGETR